MRTTCRRSGPLVAAASAAVALVVAVLGAHGSAGGAATVVPVTAMSVVVAEPAPCRPVWLFAAPGTGPDVVGAVSGPLAERLGERLRVVTAPPPPTGTSYAAAQQEALGSLSTTVTDVATRCPDARFLLVGHSQGAHVAGDLASRIGTGQERGIPADRVLAVGLFGDPARSPFTRVVPSGAGGQGVLPVRAAGFGSLDARTIEICAPGDPVCDSPAQAAFPSLEQALKAPAHASYPQLPVARSLTSTQWAVDSLARLAEAVPATPPGGGPGAPPGSGAVPADPASAAPTGGPAATPTSAAPPPETSTTTTGAGPTPSGGSPGAGGATVYADATAPGGATASAGATVPGGAQPTTTSASAGQTTTTTTTSDAQPTTASGAPPSTTTSCPVSSTTTSGSAGRTTTSGGAQPSTTVSGGAQQTTTSGGAQPSTTASCGASSTTTASCPASTTTSGSAGPTTTSGGAQPSTTSGGEQRTTTSGSAAETTTSGGAQPSGGAQQTSASGGAPPSTTASCGGSSTTTTSGGTQQSTTTSGGTQQSTTTSGGTQQSTTTSGGTQQSTTTSGGYAEGAGSDPGADSGPAAGATDAVFALAGTTGFDLGQGGNVENGEVPVAVASPNVPGRQAVKMELPAGGTRSEVRPEDAAQSIRAGERLFFGYSAFLPQDFPTDFQGFQVIWQLHDGETDTSPPVALEIQQGKLWLANVGELVQDLGPVTPGENVTVQMGIEFAVGGGSVSLWRDGRQVLDRFRPPKGTMIDGFDFLKTGLYRDEAGAPATSLFLNDLKVGDSLESVAQLAGATGGPPQVSPQALRPPGR